MVTLRKYFFYLTISTAATELLKINLNLDYSLNFMIVGATATVIINKI